MTFERKLSPTHEAPYRGLRVLDFGQGIASPYCAMLLGVYGADVIKVEPPEGDWSRVLGTTYGSHTTLSAVCTRPAIANFATSATSASLKRPRPRTVSMAAIRCKYRSRFSTGNVRAMPITVVS